MPLPSTGIHHITAICSDPQKNIDFYCKLLGLRLIKVTVNFDDPGSYHLYYGTGNGNPGSALTFFAWPDGKRGRVGTHSVTTIAFLIPKGSLKSWKEKLSAEKIESSTRFGEEIISLYDPDGIEIELIEDSKPQSDTAILGFQGATFFLDNAQDTSALLRNNFGFNQIGQDGSYIRFESCEKGLGSIIDLKVDSNAASSRQGTGIIHHIAFRASNLEHEKELRASVLASGYHATEVIDRNYFRSVYFREKGGVLIEIATDDPGFTFDEAAEALGTSLMLPKQHEHLREQLKGLLPPIVTPSGIRIP